MVVLLRKEYERRAETLAGLPTEQSAREYGEDFTARVHEEIGRASCRERV